MKLMSIKRAMEIVEEFKQIYPDDYRDIRIDIKGNYRDINNKPYTLFNLEVDLGRYEYKKDIEYIALKINDHIVLDEYELLDINTINLHSPVEVASF